MILMNIRIVNNVSEAIIVSRYYSSYSTEDASITGGAFKAQVTVPNILACSGVAISMY
jgi:hypothetical protein